ncbi:MAG: glutamate--tRNA ligase [Candidatus Pacebacteria bacterium]|nr:glutamate--tRNA ligase [Candidatus Paceibacterota bacterium]
MDEQKPIRVRIAPSPTGYLHLGTARAALFNYLYAKKEKGTFIVRIEDTDVERSLPIYEEGILRGLKALNLTWDEGPDTGGPYGPYRQSERTDIYQKYIQKLVEQEKAYRCFCTKDEIEEEKKALLSQGIFPKYSGKCRSLSHDQIKEYEDQNRSSVIRLKVPSNVSIEFQDIIRGSISVNSDTIGDVVIAKNETSPLYNLAVVIDDHEMNISHVIRGEDHISNTPKQILIAHALGIEVPKYAHLPLVLSPDRSKMSKRKMETSFDQYIADGYLPEALVNFLALLGWHPEGDQEILSLDELIKQFSLRRVQKGGAVFNVDRLDWFNAQYIKSLPLEELIERIKKYIPQEWCSYQDTLTRAVEVERGRLTLLSQFKEAAAFFFTPIQYDARLLVWQSMSLSDVAANLIAIKSELSQWDESAFVNAVEIENGLMPLAMERGRGECLWPLRVALSGLRNSPSPFEIMYVLGKTETLARIDIALAQCS